jgi:hypothetical protein
VGPTWAASRRPRYAVGNKAPTGRERCWPGTHPADDACSREARALPTSRQEGEGHDLPVALAFHRQSRDRPVAVSVQLAVRHGHFRGPTVSRR